MPQYECLHPLSTYSIGVRTFTFIETKRHVMIAPGLPRTCCISLLKRSRAEPTTPRFHSDIMSNFLFDLGTNLAILAALLIACHLCNLARPDLALNGGYTYLLLAAPAFVFDATLTFLVFADAPSRYGKFGTPNAFVERACAYTLSCALALYCARCLRIRMKKAKAGDALVIRTSPYTESHLPM
jgi:hypothetical protein